VELSSSLRCLASLSVPQGVIGATTRAARAFSPELDLSTTERLVLAYIIQRCGSRPTVGGSGYVCVAKLREMAAAVGRSIRTVRYACRALEGDEAAGKPQFITSELKQRGEILPTGHTAERETLVVRTVKDLKATKVAGLNGWVFKAFSPLLRDGKGRGLSATRRAVLAVFLLHAGTDGWCWPSYATIAGMTGLTERTVGEATRELVALGHVTRRLVAPTWGSPHWQTLYKPTPSRLVRAMPDSGAKPDTSPVLPGNRFLPTQQQLPTKEILEADPSESGPAVQLDLFVQQTGGSASRATEIDAVMRVASVVAGAKPRAEDRDLVQARLGEGVHANEIALALQVAAGGPGEKSGLLGKVLRSKQVIVAYLETIGKSERLRRMDYGPVKTEEDRNSRMLSVEVCEDIRAKIKAMLSSPPPPHAVAR